MKVWKHLISIFKNFSFSVLLFLLIAFSYSFLNRSQLALFCILLQLPSPPSVESAILINLFLFFSLEMTAFNDVETGSCSSEMFLMMSRRSFTISEFVWPFCLKVSNWIFPFFSLFFSNLVLNFVEPWLRLNTFAAKGFSETRPFMHVSEHVFGSI